MGKTRLVLQILNRLFSLIPFGQSHFLQVIFCTIKAIEKIKGDAFSQLESVAFPSCNLCRVKRFGKHKKTQNRKLFRMEQRSLQTFLILGI